MYPRKFITVLYKASVRTHLKKEEILKFLKELRKYMKINDRKTTTVSFSQASFNLIPQPDNAQQEKKLISHCD